MSLCPRHNCRITLIALIALIALFAFAAALAATCAHAQPWPARPVRVVVPFPAGGPADVLGRVMAARFTAALKQ